MDNPHLVTMENGLQDLLDAVTVANSRWVSASGLGGRLGREAGRGGTRRMAVLCSTEVQLPACGE